MREVIMPFLSNIVDDDDVPYGVRVLGQQRADGTWEGRIEFTGAEHSRPFCTAVEAMRSTAAELEEWAAGLQRIYLQGALQRARRRAVCRAERRSARKDRAEERA